MSHAIYFIKNYKSFYNLSLRPCKPTLKPIHILLCVTSEQNVLKFSLLFYWKELSSCHKFGFLNLHIFAIWCCSPLIFQTMNPVESNSLTLEYQRSTPSVCKDIEITKLWVCGKNSVTVNNIVLCNRTASQKYLENQIYLGEKFQFFP